MEEEKPLKLHLPKAKKSAKKERAIPKPKLQTPLPCLGMNGLPAWGISDLRRPAVQPSESADVRLGTWWFQGSPRVS